MKMKVEIKVMLPQAKECQRLPENNQKLRERHGQILPHTPRRKCVCVCRDRDPGKKKKKRSWEVTHKSFRGVIH